MAEQREELIEDIIADRERIGAALTRAAHEAILAHARAGRAVPMWRDGHVVWVSPEEVLAEFGEPPAPAPKQAS